MRIWRMTSSECYLCGVKEGGQYPFVLEEKDDKGNPISREVASLARLVEIRRRFDKDNEVVFYICTRCELLTVLEPEREFFRFAFPEEKPTEDKMVPIIERLRYTDKRLEKVISDLEALSLDCKKEKEKRIEEKSQQIPKSEITISADESTDMTNTTDTTDAPDIESTPTSSEEEKKDE